MQNKHAFEEKHAKCTKELTFSKIASFLGQVEKPSSKNGK